MLSFGTLFSGAGLLDIGFKQAGMQHKWGIELSDRIANIARNNEFNVLTGDVIIYDYSSLEPVDWLHASPPCVRASSLANKANRSTANEIELDRDLANAICRAVEYFKPVIFSLENVPNYTKFVSFNMIKDTLEKNGYNIEYKILLSGDYSVPQIRRRLILIAALGVEPKFPIPHIKRIYWNNVLDETCYEPVDYLKHKNLRFLVELGTFKNNQIISKGGLFVNYETKKYANTIYSENQLMSAVTANGYIFLWKEGQMYRVNNLGLCRLQTVPDNYSIPIKKAIGNGVPCSLAESIARTMLCG